ncbi:MAG: hypothetical protein ACOYM8_19250, partial [Caulobacterales bacterium]
MAPLGNSGIPTETRVLFNTFAQRADFDVSGLLVENTDRKSQFLARSPRKPHEREMHASAFLHILSGGDPPFGVSRLAGRMRDLRVTAALYRNDKFGLVPMPTETFDDALWRLLFAASVPPQDRKTITQRPFYYTNMTFWEVVASVELPFAPRPNLQMPDDFDFIVLQDARPIQAPRGVTKIIRYHDAIPVTDPDLIGDSRYSRIHEACVRRSVGHAHFVCNSTATRDALIGLFPQAEPMTHVIPCVVNADVAPESAIIPPHDVIRTRRMAQVRDGGSSDAKSPAAPKFVAAGDLTPTAPYVLAVTTLE